MITTHISPGTALPPFVPIPRAVLESGTLTMTACLAYGLLLSRALLSVKNGGSWIDDSGHVYCIYTIDSLADQLGRGKTATQSALAQLEAEGLIFRVKQGYNKPNHIYVLVPVDDDE